MQGNPNPSPETRFQPGNTASKGGTRDTLSMTRLKKFTRSTLAEKLVDMFNMNIYELTKIYRDDAKPAIEQAIAKAIMNAKEAGDFSALDRIFERCIGKVPQKLEGDFGAFGGRPLPQPIVNYVGVKVINQINAVSPPAINSDVPATN